MNPTEPRTEFACHTASASATRPRQQSRTTAGTTPSGTEGIETYNAPAHKSAPTAFRPTNQRVRVVIGRLDDPRPQLSDNNPAHQPAQKVEESFHLRHLPSHEVTLYACSR